ncbi:ROK family protein [Paenibacillus sp. P26]|nr:ROK family protein [Paenibacillus sp. P26]UUZ94797.1 ROK family protein [Paenibacillus sp. P25]
MEKTETHYSISNSLGEMKEQGKTSSVLTDGVPGLTKQIGETIAKYPKIRSIAIGVPGAVNNGRIIYIPGYDSFQRLDLKEAFEERFSIPVVIENDMNAAVLGYHARRPGKGNTSLVYLYFGQNGPGAGILINGDVVRGSTYFSGEVSFVPQYDDRNFLQALNGEMSPEAPHRQDGRIDAVGRLVATFAAILNPHAVIFCKDEVNGQMLNRIAAKSAEYIPGAHLPELILSDWKQDYLAGLQTLGLGLMVSATSS